MRKAKGGTLKLTNAARLTEIGVANKYSSNGKASQSSSHRSNNNQIMSFGPGDTTKAIKGSLASTASEKTKKLTDD